MIPYDQLKLFTERQEDQTSPTQTNTINNNVFMYFYY